MPELRKDPIVGRWVIIATERARRPSDFNGTSGLGDEKTPCPFCPGNERYTPPEVLADRAPGRPPNGEGWSTRVVPNKFPALQVEGGLDRRGEGIYDRMNGIGAHEVIIETTRHERELSELSIAEIVRVLRAYRERIVDLKNDLRFRYILVFKNHGEAAGATLEHGHTQLIATPIIPMVVQEELEGSLQHYRLKERCVYCDIVDQELKDGRRVVTQNAGFLAIEPFAPRFPFETWILPKRHHSAFEETADAELPALAGALRETLGRLRLALNRPHYNFLIHSAPCRDPRLDYYHWHLEIMPRLTKVAGFEWGTGFYINPTPPEEAALYLRSIEPAAAPAP
ncbi:MAG TPA: galactose-1-phosphate uridylyltransferase [Candidatus Eisenbacteria bacterium]